MVTTPRRTLYKLLSLDSQVTPCRRQEPLSQLELCLFSCQGFFLTQEKERKKKMKLGKVEFCHFLQLIALFLCFSGMSQAELSRSRSKPYFQSGRSRTKRSWVWNQFFVLEEYMGSDPLYVGKVKTPFFRELSALSSRQRDSYCTGDTLHSYGARMLDFPRVAESHASN